MGELFPRALLESAEGVFVCEFLETFSDYCARRGLVLDPAAPGWLDRVYRFLNEADAQRPAALRAALDLVAFLADEDGHRRLLSLMVEKGDLAGLPPRITPLELSLWAFEHKPDIFAEGARRKQADAKDNFWEFLPQRRVDLRALSLETRDRMRQRMAEHHAVHGHTGYAELDVIEQPHETRLLWSRGRPTRSHGVINLNEQREQLRYVPERHDLATIDRATGRLSLAVDGKPHLEFMRRMLGEELFGDPEHFSITTIYESAPLVARGPSSISVRGIAGLRKVRLRRLTLVQPTGRLRTFSSTHGCVFDEDARDIASFARTPGTRVTEMRFALLYGHSPRERMLEVRPPNHIIFDRQVAEPVVREFLTRRGLAHYGADEVIELAVAG